MTVPDESDRESTLPPSWITFSAQYWATLPLPLIRALRPLTSWPFVASISCAKYTLP